MVLGNCRYQVVFVADVSLLKTDLNHETHETMVFFQYMNNTGPLLYRLYPVKMT